MAGAIQTLLILDELFRATDVVARRRWVDMTEEVTIPLKTDATMVGCAYAARADPPVGLVCAVRWRQRGARSSFSRACICLARN